jgi:hypothetical protein
MRIDLQSVLLRPLVAGALMVGCMALLQSSFWGVRATIGALLYVGSLLLLNSAKFPGLAAGWSAGAGGK